MSRVFRFREIEWIPTTYFVSSSTAKSRKSQVANSKSIKCQFCCALRSLVKNCLTFVKLVTRLVNCQLKGRLFGYKSAEILLIKFHSRSWRKPFKLRCCVKSFWYNWRCHFPDEFCEVKSLNISPEDLRDFIRISRLVFLHPQNVFLLSPKTQKKSFTRVEKNKWSFSPNMCERTLNHGLLLLCMINKLLSLLCVFSPTRKNKNIFA